MKPPLHEMTTICGLRNLDDPVGHSHIVSIIDPDWPEPLDFQAWPASCRMMLRFHDETSLIAGKTVPTNEHVRRILAFGQKMSAAPEGSVTRLFVHCLSGVSRSTAAAVMLWAQAEPDVEHDELFAALARVRPGAWPNSLMLQHADAELGRDGALVSAALRFFRARLEGEPGLEEKMRRLRRGADLEAVVAMRACRV